jgi:hypothetical protein
VARSLLQSLVTGTRQILTAQLIVAVAAIALAGWTLGVTSELIRERDRLRERVIQLEETMGSSGVVVPETPASVVDTPTYAPASSTYPPDISNAVEVAPEESARAEVDETSATAALQDEDQASSPDLGGLFESLFSPAPPMRLVVLHVRGEADRGIALGIASELQTQGDVRVVINQLQPRDPRASGYTYFDGRQGRRAAALVTQFHDLAREKQVAAWSAQLRGVALPAQGEYGADRLDIVLPALPSTETSPPPLARTGAPAQSRSP